MSSTTNSDLRFIQGKRRPRSTCASAQSDQNLRCPVTESVHTVYRRKRRYWPDCVRAFVVCCLRLGAGKSAQSDRNFCWLHEITLHTRLSKVAHGRFWSDCANTQSDLNLRWAHMSRGTFSDVKAYFTLQRRLTLAYAE